MSNARGSDSGRNTVSVDLSNALHRIRVNEARAQVSSQRAEGITEEWATNTTTTDAELLLKLVEARYARETSARDRTGQMEWDALRQRALHELLRKAALEVPARPPKDARFAVFCSHGPTGRLFSEEQYPKWVEECGRSKATFLYWWQFLLIYSGNRLAAAPPLEVLSGGALDHSAPAEGVALG
jgi:hypothetical protein